MSMNELKRGTGLGDSPLKPSQEKPTGQTGSVVPYSEFVKARTTLKAGAKSKTATVLASGAGI